MHVILMGAQGAGKGTQATRIAPVLSLVHLSTGDLFRAAIASGNELGRTAQGYLDRGELVPDDVTLGIVDSRLSEIAQEPGVQGALFDGFPRTQAQAEGLDVMLDQRQERLAAVIEIQVPMDVLVRRLTGRRICERCGATYHIEFNPPRVPSVCDVCGGALIQRADDQPEPIKRRLTLYFEQTAPLLAYYQRRDLLIAVDGDRPMDDVAADIVQAVQRKMRAPLPNGD
jgi:adenylate kinase